MKFVVDVCLSMEVAEGLRKAGEVADHWSQIGRSNDKDSTIMQWCLEHDHCLITADLDFGTLLRHAGSAGPSVIILRTTNHSPAYILPILIAIIEDLSQEIRAGALISADGTKARVRSLPIK